TSTDPIVLDVGLDWRMVAFNVAIVGLTTVAFASGLAMRASARMPINDGARSTEGRRRVAAREVLVSIQVAMSVVLLSAALLFWCGACGGAAVDVLGQHDRRVAALRRRPARSPALRADRSRH